LAHDRQDQEDAANRDGDGISLTAVVRADDRESDEKTEAGIKKAPEIMKMMLNVQLKKGKGDYLE
jgi:hypothetical protein